MQYNYNSFIYIINFHGLFRAEKLVPVEYWCPYGTSVTVLTNQLCKLLIVLFKVPNIGAFTVHDRKEKFTC